MYDTDWLEEKFCLKWNDFQDNIIQSFNKLRTESDFHDVTLVTDDYKHVSAHRVVLSSCSGFFKNILKISKQSHPMICIAGVTSIELDNILDYMYNGEVQVSQDQIDTFLMVAQRLEIEGLLEQENVSNNEETSIKINFKEETFTEASNKSQNKALYKENKEQSAMITNLSFVDLSSIEDIEEKINEYLVKCDDGTLGCKVCGKNGVKHSRNMKNHIESHLEGLSFPCRNCGKTFRLRNSLYKHMSTVGLCRPAL